NPWIGDACRSVQSRIRPKISCFARFGDGTSLALKGVEEIWLYPTGVSFAAIATRRGGLSTGALAKVEKV
ncbi:MAG TPA: hypothetical protein VFQ06_15455, partial [Nitrospira sp.]|nr:hypothetical protein [Nitrospira sp.]